MSNKNESFLDKLNKCYQLLKELKLDSAYTLITRLGLPIVTYDNGLTDTAAVFISNTKMKKINFTFSADFAAQLEIDEMCAVLLHEAYHVFFGHMTSDYGNLNQKIWNLACDAVINDMIDFYFSGKLKLPDMKITGEKLIGENCKDKTSEEVYSICIGKFKDFLPSIYALNTIDDHRIWDQNKNKDEIMSKIEEEIEKIANKFPNDILIKSIKNKVNNYGAGNFSGIRKINHNSSRQAFDKKQLLANLSHVMPKNTNKYNAVWHRPSKKLISVYPEIILPTYEQQSKPSAIFVVDTSASITDEWLSIFKDLCKRCSTIIDCKFFSFDTNLYNWDLKEFKIAGGGGTSIRCIEEKCISLPKYPDNIIVLTDGYFDGGFDLKYPSRWTFLIKMSYYFSKSKNNQYPDKEYDKMFEVFIDNKSKKIYLR